MKVERNKSLKALNTLAVDSVCEYFYEATTAEQILDALNFAEENKLKLRVLGEGSNMLLPKNVSGLVVLPKIRGIGLISEKGIAGHKADGAGKIYLKVGAGENWHRFVHYCAKNKMYGLENLALIPGSVGASPIQNIGAYGVEVSEFICELEVVEVDSKQRYTLSNADCQFSYRDSVFKRFPGRYIVCHVVFALNKEFKANLAYAALDTALQNSLKQKNINTINAESLIETVEALRQSKLPDPKQLPNAGSFFKNPVVSQQQFEVLQHRFPDIVAFDLSDGNKKLAAAWLIEKSGWKGKEVDGIAMYSKQALVLTNPGQKELSAILQYANRVKADVQSLFGVELEIEPQLI